MQYINAVQVIGTKRPFTCTIQTNENASNFNSFDLTLYSVRFRVLGSPTANAKVLVEHLITGNTDIETVGQITNAAAGEFTFTLSAQETLDLGLGDFPISLELVDVNTNELIYTITEGGRNGEFNKIRIVQV